MMTISKPLTFSELDVGEWFHLGRATLQKIKVEKNLIVLKVEKKVEDSEAANAKSGKKEKKKKKKGEKKKKQEPSYNWYNSQHIAGLKLWVSADQIVTRRNPPSEVCATTTSTPRS